MVRRHYEAHMNHCAVTTWCLGARVESRETRCQTGGGVLLSCIPTQRYSDPSHQDCDHPRIACSSHEYQNVSQMDISSNLWPGFVRSLKSIVRLFQCVLRCHGYSAAHTIDLQIKLFLCSLFLQLLHVFCVPKLIAHCFCCLHYIY